MIAIREYIPKVYEYEGKKINDWLSDDKIPNGITKYNIEYIRAFREIDSRFSSYSVMLYFLVTEIDANEFRSMFTSCNNQRKFIASASITLKNKMVTKEWVRVFERDIQKLYKRLDHISFIINEDIYLTEYYPYFEQHKIDDFLDIKGSDLYEITAKLKKEIEIWNAEHKSEVDAHVLKTEPIRKQREERNRMLQLASKKEKEERKAQKKAEKAEIAEMKKNAKEHRKRERMIERSFECYYK